MNDKIKELAAQANEHAFTIFEHYPGFPKMLPPPGTFDENRDSKFAELIIEECTNREKLLGAIARGWCGDANSQKTMDSELAIAIFDEVKAHLEDQIGEQLVECAF